MSNILFYDTETSGLPNDDLPPHHPSQPHVVQVAALLASGEGKNIASMSVIITPDMGTVFEDEAVKTHGITFDYAREHGIPGNIAYDMLIALWWRCSMRVGHNETFDNRIVYGDLLRLRYGLALDWHEAHTNCTMNMSRPICKMPPTPAQVRWGYDDDFKNPKLEEAYEFLLGKPMKGAHNAMADVVATKAVYFAILERAA